MRQFYFKKNILSMLYSSIIILAHFKLISIYNRKNQNQKSVQVEKSEKR